MTRRNSVTWHVNHLKTFVELPPELLKKENILEITNPNREHSLLWYCHIEAVDERGVSHFSEVYSKELSAGNHNYTYMNFGLVHPECGILL